MATDQQCHAVRSAYRVPLSSFRLLAALCFISVSLLFTGCPKEDKPPNVGISTSRDAREPAVVPGAVAFNGERAMDHVRKQMEIGPRVPGSPELAKTRDYITSVLKKSGLLVRADEFTATTPFGEKKMVNIVAEVPGESPDVIMIASHYDTKFFKDMQFVGANDPGASVGTLLELGRVLGAAKDKPKLTYWLVFFDGEEAFCNEWEDCHNTNPADPKHPLPDNTYGSRHLVTKLASAGELKGIRAMLLLDMMGSRDLQLGRDTMSVVWLQDIVWQTARELNYGKYFLDRPEDVGGDDHEPFLRAGVDALDIIQLESYRYWHRADDTIDKISPESMKIVGDVVLASLPKIAAHIEAQTSRAKASP